MFESLSRIGTEVRRSRKKQALAILALVGVVFITVAPLVGERSFVFYAMFWTGLALSLNLIYGFTGYMPFGYFAFYGVGAYAGAIGYTQLNLPMPVAIPLAGGVSLLLGVIFIPMFKLEGIYFAIVNFAAALAIRTAIPLTPESITGGSRGIQFTEAYNPIMSYYAMAIVFFLVLGCTVVLMRSRLGILLKAVRDEPKAAEMSRVNTGRVRSYAWFLSAFFPGMIGAINIWNVAIIDPNNAFDEMMTIKPLLYLVFGGPGTAAGPVAGSASLFTLDDLIWQYLPFGSYLVTGVLLMVVALVFPRGVVTELKRRFGTQQHMSDNSTEDI